MTIYHKHHIIPRHAGGTDDPENLVLLTVEEHAESHRILFEEHGRWQDKLAWQGLAKLMTKEELTKHFYIEAGRMGGAGGWTLARRKKQSDLMLDMRKTRLIVSKTYEICDSDGNIEIVSSLLSWCNARNINYNAFHKACITRRAKHRGYTAKLL